MAQVIEHLPREQGTEFKLQVLVWSVSSECFLPGLSKVTLSLCDLLV
jgi:hypothetical protein